jgi:hypothetical protein
MRKLLLTITVSLLLLAIVAPTALAGPGPSPVAGQIPTEILPGDAAWDPTFGFAAYDDLWIEVNELPFDQVWELPTLTDFNSWYGDDHFRGPVPIGFNFKYMGGPPKGLPIYRMWQGNLVLMGYDYQLRDEGYDEVWVCDNGYLVFKDPVHRGPPPSRPTGSWNWGWQGFSPEPPNNYLAPFWDDFEIGDNNYLEFDALGRSTWMERPRGKLLAATVGEAPNRIFVVEWLNARNYDTGHLGTFQVQLFEGSNAILFLYKEFQGKGTEPVYLTSNPVIVGMEDYFGSVSVGTQFAIPEELLANGAIVVPQQLPAPVADESMRGFVY